MAFRKSQVECELRTLRFARIVNVREQGAKHHYYGFADTINPFNMRASPSKRVFFQRKGKKMDLFVGPSILKGSNRRPDVGSVLVGVAKASEKGEEFAWWFSDGGGLLHFYHALLKRRPQKINSVKFYQSLGGKDDELWALYFLLQGRAKLFVANDHRHPVRKSSKFQHDVGFLTRRPPDEFVYLASLFAKDKGMFQHYLAMGGASCIQPSATN